MDTLYRGNFFMESPGPEYLLLVSFVVLWIALCTIAQVAMKVGMKQVQEGESLARFLSLETLGRLAGDRYIVGGFCLYVIATFLWLGALSKLDVSVLSPLGSLIFVATALVAFVVLGERITPVRWFSIALISLGTFILIRS